MKTLNFNRIERKEHRETDRAFIRRSRLDYADFSAFLPEICGIGVNLRKNSVNLRVLMFKMPDPVALRRIKALNGA